MKHVILAAIAVCSLATACSVKNERTVVAAPTPAPATVVYADPTATPTTTTVYTTPASTPATTTTVYQTR
ncbi:MAG: hypothetical protein QOG78_4776 [Rhodospirillaceae bacterium]|jgi:hypothetical protein|nr:hypothetical protein [Rhodospirillaceae bacterium]MEA2849495.1 hypothetical protein [Rhodospirillaceae bacterium]